MMLQSWLGHLAPEHFFESFWGKQDAILSTWLPGSLKVPFTLWDFQSLLNEGRLRFPQLQCFDGGAVANPSLYTCSTHSSMSDVISASMVSEMILQHKTVRITDVQTLHPSLRSFASDLAESFGCEVKINAYYCKGPAGGLSGHYDGHHIFAAQIAGQKVWRLGPVVIDSPDRDFRPRPLTAPPTVKTVIVKAGYVLYMPPGMWHDVYTDDVSLHLSIGIHPDTWSKCLQKLLDASRQRHPLLRAALPFSVIGGRCVYRTEVKQELQQLLDLLKEEVPTSMQQYLAKPQPDPSISIPAPAEPLPLSDLPIHEEISEALNDIWARASHPCAIYLRGNVPKTFGSGGDSWDLDVVLVVDEFDDATKRRISSAREDIRDRFSQLPALDLYCCTRTDLVENEELLQVKISLSVTGHLVRGNDLRSDLQFPSLDHTLAERLAQQMRRSLSAKLSKVKALPEDVASFRLTSLCKSALRIAAVPVIREEARFIRDPLACYFEIVRRFPDQLADADLVLNGLFGQRIDPKSVIGAAENLIGRILR